MKNKPFVYKSDKFDVVNTTDLSLFVYPNSLFVFAKNKEGVNLAVFHFEKCDWINLEEELNFILSEFSDVTAQIFFHNPYFTLVPDTFIQAGNEKNYLSVLGEFPDDSWYFTTSVESGDFSILSLVPEKIKNKLESKFSGIRFSHGSSSLISYLLKERDNQLKEEIVVNCHDCFIYLAAFSEKSLVAFNRFEVQTLDDFIKYILIVKETLRFDHNLLQVTVYGTSDHFEITEEIGNQYFSHFRLTNPHTNQSYSSGFDQSLSKNIFEFFWQNA